MNLADLERTLEKVLATGKLGTPVALRIHAALDESAGDPLDRVSLFASLVRRVCEDSQGQIQAKRHPSGRQVSVLWTDARGRTAFLSLASVPKDRQDLHVLVIGNHGITRLVGGDLWNDAVSRKESSLWSEEIRESLKTGTSIAVGLS